MAHHKRIPAWEKFGLLTVVASFRSGIKKFKYDCLCECGNFTKEEGKALRSGDVVSCGCALEARSDPTNIGNNRVYADYKRNALLSHRGFLLSKEEFSLLIHQDCHYCDRNPYSKIKAADGFTYNGIDRIDNSLGYTYSNTVTCCSDCNYSKGTLSKQEFIKMAEEIVHKWGLHY